MRKNHTLLIGAHMSIAGGLNQAIIRGQSIGCTAIQIFTKSNRQWAGKAITDQEIELFKTTWKNSSVVSIIAHASYLINLGSAHPDINTKSVAALVFELKQCELLDIPYLVLHPGSSLTMNSENALKKITENIDVVLDAISGKTMLLLETMAGQGSSLCYQFEHIAKIYQNSKHQKRLGVCFDTCHAFAAGYDFRNKESYEQLWKNFDDIIGLQNLYAMHINDSKKELGTRVDRHEHIGKGKLGLLPFELIFNDPRFFDIPKILETPKDTLIDDARNLELLKELILPETKKLLSI